MKSKLSGLVAIAVLFGIVAPVFAVLTVERTAEELAKEFKKDGRAALKTYADPGQVKDGSIPGDVLVKVDGVLEKINGKRLTFKTGVEGIKLELTVESIPDGLAAGNRVEMSHHSHVDSFNNKTITLKSETVKKIMSIGK